MVQGVELLLGHQPQQVGKLEGGHTARLQQRGKALEEIIDIRHMSQHVVGRHQVGTPALCCQGCSRSLAKEQLTNLQALLPRRTRGAGSRFDTQAGNAALRHVLQQVTVISGDFHHPALGIQAKTLDHLRDVTLGVLQPAAGVGAKIGIVGIEQTIGRTVILGLYQPAAVAHQHPQRHPLLGLIKLIGAQVGIGRRRSTQVYQRYMQAGTTTSALHNSTP